MKFSSTSNLDGIIQIYEKFIDLGDGYISGDATRLKEATAIINRVQHRVWHTIFMATGNWKYDDGGYTDLPYGLAALVADQKRYALPSDALTIQRIELKDEDGNWFKLIPLTQEKIPGAIVEFQDVSGMPVYYTVIDEVIELFPAANYSQAESLRVYFDRDSVDFATSDTTKTPGFASPYHEILPIKAAIEWYKIKQPTSPTLPILIQDDLKLENSIKEFYGKRFKDYKPRITRKREIYK